MNGLIKKVFTPRFFGISLGVKLIMFTSLPLNAPNVKDNFYDLDKKEICLEKKENFFQEEIYKNEKSDNKTNYLLNESFYD